MKVKFQRRFAMAFQHLAFHVDMADVRNGQRTALATANIDEHTLFSSNAAMPVVVHDVGLLEHANTVHELLLDCDGVAHMPSY
jgi:hypothetical protein